MQAAHHRQNLYKPHGDVLDAFWADRRPVPGYGRLCRTMRVDVTPRKCAGVPGRRPLSHTDNAARWTLRPACAEILMWKEGRESQEGGPGARLSQVSLHSCGARAPLSHSEDIGLVIGYRGVHRLRLLKVLGLWTECGFGVGHTWPPTLAPSVFTVWAHYLGDRSSSFSYLGHRIIVCPPP